MNGRTVTCMALYIVRYRNASTVVKSPTFMAIKYGVC